MEERRPGVSVFTISACALWGGAATYCFFEAWMAFLALAACAIGGLRRKRRASSLLGFAYSRLLFLLFFGLSLVLMFQVLWVKAGLGATPAETLAFLLPSTGVMLIVGRRIATRIDDIWRRTNGNP